MKSEMFSLFSACCMLRGSKPARARKKPDTATRKTCAIEMRVVFSSKTTCESAMVYKVGPGGSAPLPLYEAGLKSKRASVRRSHNHFVTGCAVPTESIPLLVSKDKGRSGISWWARA